MWTTSDALPDSAWMFESYPDDYLYPGTDTPVPRRYLVPVVEIFAPMCCAKCEEIIREALLDVKGVTGVTTDLVTGRVTVSGYMDPQRLLQKVKKVQKDATFWPGIAYEDSGITYEDSYIPVNRDVNFEPYDTTYRATHSKAPVYEEAYYPCYPPLYITNPNYLKHLEPVHYME